MFRFYKTILNLKTRLQEQNQKKTLIFFHCHLNLFICCKSKLKTKFIFYKINSFAIFEQPYFCCKSKLKKKIIFYTMTLIRVPKVPFRFFDKLKNKIQNFIL